MKLFWINTTEDCNLNCVYCYQKEKQNKYLDLNKINKIVNMINTYEENIVINFFGGEPLLNFSVIEKTITEIKKRKMNNVAFSITTNLSILTSRAFHFLTKNNVSISISLDGCEESYTSGRFSKKVKVNYFKVVMKNLNKFIEIKYPHLSFIKVISYNNYKYLFKDTLFFSNFIYPVYFNFDQGIVDGDTYNLNLKDFQSEIKKSFNFYLKNNLKQFYFFNKIVSTVKTMFDSSELFRQRENCTNYNNISYSFDVDGKVFPCHFIPELHYHNKNSYNFDSIAELDKNIRYKSFFESLNDEDKFEYLKQESYLDICTNCKYNYFCILEKTNDFKNICIYNIYKLKNKLNEKKQKNNNFFCIKKFCYDIVFEYISKNGVDLLDNI